MNYDCSEVFYIRFTYLAKLLKIKSDWGVCDTYEQYLRLYTHDEYSDVNKYITSGIIDIDLNRFYVKNLVDVIDRYERDTNIALLLPILWIYLTEDI